ncbi:hypothetical protein PVNG_06162 [Plasmodium vivax North Korean]|uniref:Uncharacterized protein n=1 Tax=Plasmodium vivax North Korean TaxID=1035514 RepID=A0A0J9U2B9_PLAVI|nr:hypothetical protein PVNG_06162 [Plasmodium vivax North Korean]
MYEFFEKIENYIEKANLAESNAASTEDERECDSFVLSFGSNLKNSVTAKRICVQFRKLYYSLTELNCITNTVHNYEECRNFLNYWINFKLRKNIKNENNNFCHVYNGLESQITGRNGGYINLAFIYDINKDELDKMSKLYNLYEKYHKINAIINTEQDLDKNELATLSTQCCTDYNQASYICNDGIDNGNNSKFCQNLKTFRTKFEGLYENVNKRAPEYSHYFKSLPKCPNNKIMTTAVTGTVIGLIPLLGVLYKVSGLNIKL